MNIIDNLIYDRTHQDLVGETDKAYISYMDLNRIEEAVAYLSGLLNKYAYRNFTNNKTNWRIDEIRKQEDCDRIKVNYEVLKSVFVYKFDVPEFKWENITEANNIEKILYDIETLIISMEQVFIRSGVANCGQNRVWQQRFRREYYHPVNYMSWNDLEQEYWSDFSEEETWAEYRLKEG